MAYFSQNVAQPSGVFPVQYPTQLRNAQQVGYPNYQRSQHVMPPNFGSFDQQQQSGYPPYQNPPNSTQGPHSAHLTTLASNHGYAPPICGSFGQPQHMGYPSFQQPHSLYHSHFNSPWTGEYEGYPQTQQTVYQPYQNPPNWSRGHSNSQLPWTRGYQGHKQSQHAEYPPHQQPPYWIYDCSNTQFPMMARSQGTSSPFSSFGPPQPMGNQVYQQSLYPNQGHINSQVLSTGVHQEQNPSGQPQQAANPAYQQNHCTGQMNSSRDKRSAEAEANQVLEKQFHNAPQEVAGNFRAEKHRLDDEQLEIPRKKAKMDRKSPKADEEEGVSGITGTRFDPNNNLRVVEKYAVKDEPSVKQEILVEREHSIEQKRPIQKRQSLLTTYITKKEAPSNIRVKAKS